MTISTDTEQPSTDHHCAVKVRSTSSKKVNSRTPEVGLKAYFWPQLINREILETMALEVDVPISHTCTVDVGVPSPKVVRFAPEFMTSEAPSCASRYWKMAPFNDVYHPSVLRCPNPDASAVCHYDTPAGDEDPSSSSLVRGPLDFFFLMSLVALLLSLSYEELDWVLLLIAVDGAGDAAGLSLFVVFRYLGGVQKLVNGLNCSERVISWNDDHWNINSNFALDDCNEVLCCKGCNGFYILPRYSARIPSKPLNGPLRREAGEAMEYWSRKSR
ncbi:hypothetical protein Nepgr_006663 [Nepenthes gracilis]|uniref:Uncharacterized protein n=1 Tax=Nepenthes gracilis TaxID=150966 RepID=A0AAD3S5K4_NEPGR|nr:hypothetical protein Nepgr_006663 [Nepenthes gracilis]